MSGFNYTMARQKRLTRAAAIAGMAIVAASCSTDPDAESASVSDGVTDPVETDISIDELPTGPPASIDPATIPRGEVVDFGPAPVSPEGPYSPEVAAAVDQLFGTQIDAIFVGRGLGRARNPRSIRGSSGPLATQRSPSTRPRPDPCRQHHLRG